jgi:serine/threonine protein kinase
MSTASSPPRRLGLSRTEPGISGGGVRQRFPYAVGDRIAGDLTVIGHLAAGRVGHLYQVWSARDWCAYTCKILAQERRGRRPDVAALRRESRIIRRLQHPALVRSFGEGEHEGLPFLLMEYLPGPSLFDLLRRAPRAQLPVSDGVRAAIHLGAALNHLHRRGFLHLDLKPANLLLRDGIPVLVDFDTARPISAGVRPRTRLGTPPYMAPEHAARQALSPATDVYGLGALLYELVTGRWAFEDSYLAEGSTLGETAQYPQLAGVSPEPPSRFRAGITPTLDETVLTCLAPDPADRFPGMHQLLLALMAELGEPVSLWPEGVQAERRSEPRD